ncbi:Bcr/CflA family efflux MFS transporter [Actinoplanes awajinensis]|uniref:Bcr/CflA subfamily drug resistance transporter n=1 Tax=Actinoplanes awajinensis subsp. mycoplanecinus TaxID=135947 RepID=A0A101JDI8_9ACTN|nr:Bcr/CflA family efflux MFS transporter [Actinoplanes awajinensis]KUL24740.1 Bcr/CflA subfamily drug resistance transporter [Actinoplanes awajinensis subsp. mycoplanecinus]
MTAPSTAAADAPPESPAPRPRALLVVVLGLITAIGPLSLDMYLPALPEITAELRVPAGQVQLSLTACLIGLALGQFVFGPLSDRWGRRRPALLGVLAYAIVSFLIALAPTAPVLTGLRFLQGGVAGGVGVVVARAVVRDLSSGVGAARLFGTLTLIFGVAPIAAPSLGSAVLRAASWQGIFVALGVIGLLLTLLVLVGLPETLPPERRSAGGLGSLAGIARTLFTDRVFLGYALAQAFAFAALFAYISGSSFVLQDGYGLSPTVFSLLFGANAIGLTVLSQANGALLGRWSLRTMLGAGLVLLTVAGALALLGAGLQSLLVLLAGLFLLVTAMGLILPNTAALALDRYPAHAGAAAALLGGVQSVIGAVAAPLVGLGAAGHGVPMAVVIFGFAAAALIVTAVLTRAAPASPKN